MLSFSPLISIEMSFIVSSMVCSGECYMCVFFFNLFIFDCVGSSLLHAGLLLLRRAGVLFIAARGLLIVVASLVGEHGL